MFPECSEQACGERVRTSWPRQRFRHRAAGESEEKREEAEERLLKYHDRYAGGMPCRLPLAANLPARSTDAVGGGEKEQGAFKHARGIVRGRGLPEYQDERVRSLVDGEMALQRRPAKFSLRHPLERS